MVDPTIAVLVAGFGTAAAVCFVPFVFIIACWFIWKRLNE